MLRSALSRRLALWLAVCALLFKAAVPMLATASAQAQGKALVEVCTVYGVATVALDTSGSPAPVAPVDHPTTHAGDHCALSAVLALAYAPPGAVAERTLPPPPRPALPRPLFGHGPDPSAAWVARLQHAPPSFS